jgi:iron complex transport system permease protein
MARHAATARNRVVLTALTVAVLAAAIGAVLIEQPGLPREQRLSGPDVLRIVGSRIPLVGRAIDVSDIHAAHVNRVLTLRVPRVLLALLVGAALAVAGAVMQSFFQNPMASPYILGIASGASLGATAAFAGGVGAIAGQAGPSVCAFAGAVGVTFLVYALARRGGRVNTTMLLLTGIAVGTFAGAVAYLLMFLFTQQTIGQVLAWIMGTLNNCGWPDVAIVGPVAIVAVAFTRLFARDLNVMLMGPETAQHLGVHVERTRLVLLIASSLLTAVAVAAVGIVGFVGLVVPHVMRLIVGPDHRALIPASILGGALLVLGADVVVRAIFHEQVPLGVLTTLVGCPFFILLLTRREKTFI